MKQAIYKPEAKDYFDSLAAGYPGWRKKNSYYYSKLILFYKKIIPSGRDILEIGCRDGFLLSALMPEKGVGMDISDKMIEIARKNHPHLKFLVMPDGKIELEGKFNYIIMSNVIGYVEDLGTLFEQIKPFTTPDTKLIISSTSPFTEPIIKLGEVFGLKSYEGLVNRFYLEDIANLLQLNGFEVRETGYELPMPKKIPFFSGFVNWCIPRVKFLNKFAFIQYIIAQPEDKISRDAALSCSVIIPCFNEEGNIRECIERIPSMGSLTEIIVIDDGSTDSTAKLVRALQASQPDKNLRLISYSPNKGKGFAVRKGFESASGDILMILDADMAIPPEELINFFKPIARGKAGAVNGTRMIYMMERQAMPYFHLIGNKVFSIIFTWLIGQRVTDTLCGTKVILKQDYEKMDMSRCPWGDFDILLGIAKLGIKMKEVPVHYKARKAGKSKMKAFKHGLMLLKMCLYGFKELKLKRIFRRN